MASRDNIPSRVDRVQVSRMRGRGQHRENHQESIWEVLSMKTLALIKTRVQYRDICDKGVNLNDLLGRIARHSNLVRFLVRVWGHNPDH